LWNGKIFRNLLTRMRQFFFWTYFVSATLTHVQIGLPKRMNSMRNISKIFIEYFQNIYHSTHISKWKTNLIFGCLHTALKYRHYFLSMKFLLHIRKTWKMNKSVEQSVKNLCSLWNIILKQRFRKILNEQDV